MDTWGMIKADREAFSGYLATLTPDEWASQSLCDDWTVKGIAVHVLVSPTHSKGQIMAGFLKAGFNLHRFSAKQVATGCAHARAASGHRQTSRCRRGRAPEGELNRVRGQYVRKAIVQPGPDPSSR